MTTKLYMLACRARIQVEDESDLSEHVVVLHEHGVFAHRPDAEAAAKKLNQEELQDFMFAGEVETVEELAETVGQEQVDAVRQMYFVQEVELNEKVDAVDIPLSDGGGLEPPDVDGVIRRYDCNGNTEEIRCVGEYGWDEWASLFGKAEADFQDDPADADEA